MIDIHKATVIENEYNPEVPKLVISYEPEYRLVDLYGVHQETEPDKATLLVTRCCTINHDHLDLNREQATVLRDWLTRYIDNEFYKVIEENIDAD